jgi:hypothetical protein
MVDLKYGMIYVLQVLVKMLYSLVFVYVGYVSNWLAHRNC